MGSAGKQPRERESNLRQEKEEIAKVKKLDPLSTPTFADAVLVGQTEDELIFELIPPGKHMPTQIGDAVYFRPRMVLKGFKMKDLTGAVNGTD